MQGEVKPLTAKQESRLVDYVDQQLLDIFAQYKKRSLPTSTLQDLPSYLTATHHVLSLIMQIPPISPSGSLRVSLLLRMTGDVLDAIPGYTFPSGETTALARYLDDLDKAWLASLQTQIWDAEGSVGKDLILSSSQMETGTIPIEMTQTDRTRLRSLLILGTQKLEEWLPRDLEPYPDQDDAMDERDVMTSLEERGLFEDLFRRTWAEMGHLS